MLAAPWRLKRRLNLKDKKRKNVKGIVCVSSAIGSFCSGTNELKANTRIKSCSFFTKVQPRLNQTGKIRADILRVDLYLNSLYG